MIKHFLLISWRNILHHKFYTGILILGLAIGIAAALVLGLYTWTELTYDDFHDKKERIYLVGANQKEGDVEHVGGWTTPPTGPALKEQFPQIEQSVRLCLWFEDVIVSHGENQYAEKNIVAADSNIFKVFTIPFLSGDPSTALVKPNSVVITDKIAKKYFGDKDPLGKTLHFEHFFTNCIVTGVVKDLPSNSNVEMDILLSLNSLKTINFDFDHWANHTFSTYVLLHKSATKEEVEAKLPEFVKANLDPYLIQRFNKSFDEIYQAGDRYGLFLMPLKDVHLSTMLFENREGRRQLTYALGIIAIVIIVLVSINYTNLATVLTFSRAKEVGVRKATGSQSKTLFKQFLVESVLTTLLGLFVALGLVEIAIPLLNVITHQHLAVDYTDGRVVLLLLGFAITLGLLAGIYPAYTFASFNPIRALKGTLFIKRNRAWVRNSLVIFQFTICIVMIVSTLVAYKQLNFMTSKDHGFTSEQVVVLKRAEGLKKNKKEFKNELLKHGEISSVSYTETTPGRHFNGHGQHFVGTPADDVKNIFPLVADEDIVETLGLKLVKGRGFKDHQFPSNKALLNEAAVRMLNVKNPLEQTIDRGTLRATDVDVIGVVKDFHFKSLHFEIEPLVIYSLDIEHDPDHRANFVLVRISGSDIQATLRLLEEKWKALAGGYPFEYSFLDDDFNRLFERETAMTQVYTVFSIISISIACLGLLGLASYFATKRTKEIGIRKIVGASSANIAVILSRDFIHWIAIAAAIGSVCSWYLMHQWLQNFAYKTDLSWWIFAIATLCVLFIALGTVSWHMFKAATRNPVETLRYE